MTDWMGSWIWTTDKLPKRNSFVRFRRRFTYDGSSALLHITADSRYVLYLNGEYIGQGPVRAWPAHWHYDTYDLQPYLQHGENILAVLVNHFGEGNFQYIPAPPGLLVQLELEGETLYSDDSWKASPDPAFVSEVPRISVQEGFEEQFDARRFDGWTSANYDDSHWPSAAPLRPADDGCHSNLQPRGIPFLTMEPVLPQRIISKEVVKSIQHRFTIYLRPYILPGDTSSNRPFCHAYLATQIWSPEDCEVELVLPLKRLKMLKLNKREAGPGTVGLHAGWNSVLMRLYGQQFLLLPEFVFCIDGPKELRFSSTGDVPESLWALVGPFELTPEDLAQAEHTRESEILIASPRTTDATHAAGEALWESGDVPSVSDKPYFQQIHPEHLPAEDIFVQAYTDRVVDGAVRIEHEDGLLSGNEWTTIYPSPGGDVRVLLDFGREVLGYHRFEVSAPEGTVLDFHNFEFIQPDGRYNFAEEMNNSFRYTCREGRQTYQTYIRRGFRYSYLILRNMTGPVQIRRVEVLFCTYPQSRRGSFACSDEKLTRIWEVGAHTLRCCSEDTYTDCPTYEQTHWVGDARNEALIDWSINGDPRLWFRCLEQSGDSLDRSPLTESHVPSAWQNILPAWSFLWMRSCREYLQFTGDIERSHRLLGFIKHNVEGIERHLNPQGLFDIQAWNMFDWAAMDTPAFGVVTHQNCLAVHALNDSADMADLLGRPEPVKKWREMAASLSAAINEHLWNDEMGAYTDCLRDGKHSQVYSQQTQTVAYMAGVADGERAERCREIMHRPPEGFVRAGSPFFEFFLLEAYQQEGKVQEFLDTIRRDWGFMVDMGASTFWEMWSASDLWDMGGRLTRSHCHGWSAAPTFFLSTYILGMLPGGPGFNPAIIEPHPGNLLWCRGKMPAPEGDIEVQWENTPDKPFVLKVQAPKTIELDIRLPREGSASVNGKPYK